MGSLYRSIEGLLARMEIDERGWIVISGPLDCVNNVIVVVAPKISHGAETRRHRNRDRSILRKTANRERERERERTILRLLVHTRVAMRNQSRERTLAYKSSVNPLQFVFKFRPIESTYFPDVAERFGKFVERVEKHERVKVKV